MPDNDDIEQKDPVAVDEPDFRIPEKELKYRSAPVTISVFGRTEEECVAKSKEFLDVLDRAGLRDFVFRVPEAPPLMILVGAGPQPDNDDDDPLSGLSTCGTRPN